jgi:hypothetical protein
MNEQSFRKPDGTIPTRLDFLQLLANIDYILVRAANHRDMRATAIKELSMDITVAQNTGQHPALMVEECVCPEGYRGLSCELCAQGYQHVEDPDYPLGRCVKCSCNSHSTKCDENGRCLVSSALHLTFPFHFIFSSQTQISPTLTHKLRKMLAPGMPGRSYQTKPGLPSGCQVNIECFYAKSTCGSNYRNISSLTLVQKVIAGYLQRTVDNYS